MIDKCVLLAQCLLRSGYYISFVRDKKMFSIFELLRNSLCFTDSVFLFPCTVPSLPPQNLWANNISSTALRITWDPVPPGFVHGILRGYRVLYKKTNEHSAPYTKITASPDVRMKEIYGLKKFTYYTLRVLAFTIKGDGADSPPVNVSTDEDSKYQGIQHCICQK